MDGLGVEGLLIGVVSFKKEGVSRGTFSLLEDLTFHVKHINPHSKNQ